MCLQTTWQCNNWSELFIINTCDVITINPLFNALWHFHDKSARVSELSNTSRNFYQSQ